MLQFWIASVCNVFSVSCEDQSDGVYPFDGVIFFLLRINFLFVQFDLLIFYMEFL